MAGCQGRNSELAGDRRVARLARTVVPGVVVALCFVAHSLAWQGAAPIASGGSSKPPIVTSTEAPPGTEHLAVQWLRITVPDRGVMLAAVARPPGTGPFPAVLLLHGTHGFAHEYVQWARDLANDGFLTVAACWFSSGGGAGAKAVSPPIACPDLPPLGPGLFEVGREHIEALVQVTRALPDVRRDRLALVGHSRGGGVTLQYLLAGGNVQAAILHSSGYALQPETRAEEFTVPILILHGTADGPADGGGVNTQVAKARAFDAALKRHQKSVEAMYVEGGGHSTFFTDPMQHVAEVNRMLEFLRRHLGK